eukprot:PhM_4_TR13919/c1_g2_i5/m.40033
MLGRGVLQLAQESAGSTNSSVFPSHLAATVEPVTQEHASRGRGYRPPALSNALFNPKRSNSAPCSSGAPDDRHCCANGTSSHQDSGSVHRTTVEREHDHWPENVSRSAPPSARAAGGYRSLHKLTGDYDTALGRLGAPASTGRGQRQQPGASAGEAEQSDLPKYPLKGEFRSIITGLEAKRETQGAPEGPRSSKSEPELRTKPPKSKSLSNDTAPGSRLPGGEARNRGTPNTYLSRVLNSLFYASDWYGRPELGRRNRGPSRKGHENEDTWPLDMIPPHRLNLHTLRSMAASDKPSVVPPFDLLLSQNSFDQLFIDKAPSTQYVGNSNNMRRHVSSLCKWKVWEHIPRRQIKTYITAFTVAKPKKETMRLICNAVPLNDKMRRLDPELFTLDLPRLKDIEQMVTEYEWMVELDGVSWFNRIISGGISLRGSTVMRMRGRHSPWAGTRRWMWRRPLQKLYRPSRSQTRLACATWTISSTLATAKPMCDVLDTFWRRVRARAMPCLNGRWSHVRRATFWGSRVI